MKTVTVYVRISGLDYAPSQKVKPAELKDFVDDVLQKGFLEDRQDGVRVFYPPHRVLQVDVHGRGQ